MASLFRLYFAIVKASYDFKVTRAQKTRDSQVFFLNVQNEIFEIFKMFKNKTKFTRTACCSHYSFLLQNVFLKNPQISKENICVGVCFLLKLQALRPSTLLKRNFNKGVFLGSLINF